MPGMAQQSNQPAYLVRDMDLDRGRVIETAVCKVLLDVMRWKACCASTLTRPSEAQATTPK